MAIESFLSPADIASVSEDMQRLQKTKEAMQGGGISLVLARWNVAQGDYVALPAQTVSISFANIQAQRSATDAAIVTRQGGSFGSIAPFDVEVGDRFTLTINGGAQPGEVKIIHPVRLGRQKADFILDVEEAS
jgi:hypothetical protein